MVSVCHWGVFLETFQLLHLFRATSNPRWLCLPSEVKLCPSMKQNSTLTNWPLTFISLQNILVFLWSPVLLTALGICVCLVTSGMYNTGKLKQFVYNVHSSEFHYGPSSIAAAPGQPSQDLASSPPESSFQKLATSGYGTILLRDQDEV